MGRQLVPLSAIGLPLGLAALADGSHREESRVNSAR
jgi:hypothetical protein